MKIYKFLFINTLIMGTIMSISSSSWFPMWMGLEINMLSIIPLMSNSKSIFSSESSMKYFIIQAMASMIVLMTSIMIMMKIEFITPQVNSIQIMIMNAALFCKLGAAPFHFWFPEVMEGLTWMNCLIILSWQKIAPFMLIMNNKLHNNLNSFILISSLVISTMMIMNQISLRKILAFSSINHIAWMIAAMNSSYSTWTFYFTIYCLMNISITLTFNLYKTFYLPQLFSAMNKNKNLKILTIMNFLSLGGIPPMIGFLPKWLVIQSMSNSQNFFIIALMIFLTLIVLYIYIRITFSAITLSTMEQKIYHSAPNKKLIPLMNFMMMTSLIFVTMAFNFM
uniref:NADH dehydrogenase subunit 2 n=1 Tax=Exostira schroederi TaxID=2969970 RepID=UPI002176BE22|nr:NADH dehydrogenase subunit 2 [Exostira schroederi]UUL71665.1 NADH dehydrogenase subunit 2 [Exostira schroederi]